MASCYGYGRFGPAVGSVRAEEGNSLYDVRTRLRHAMMLTTERKYDHF